MKMLILYCLLMNFLFFIFFFHHDKVWAFLDSIKEEVKSAFAAIVNKKQKFQLFSLTPYDEDNKYNFEFLKMFYISKTDIEQLTRHANLEMPYRTYLTLCIISSLMCGFGCLVTIISINKVNFLGSGLTIFSIPFGFYLPNLLLSNRAHSRINKIDKDIPNFIDLMLICLDSGLTVEQSLKIVAGEFKEINPALAKEFDRTYFELTLFLDQKIAFTNLMNRVPSQRLKSFISIVMYNKDQGGSIYESLHQISLSLYKDKIDKLTEQGQKIPGRLTAILTICGIPIIFIIVIGPYLPKILTIFETGKIS